MFLFVSHLTVADADRAELERHLRERARLVDDVPGFLYLQLLKSEGGEATHTFVTAWEDRESFQEYMKSTEHEVSRGREPRGIRERTEVSHESYEVLLDSRLEPEWVGDSHSG